LHFLVLYIKLAALNEETPLSMQFPAHFWSTMDSAHAALTGSRRRCFPPARVAGPALARVGS
jgi:hypothetical protein